jgi:hypothetical protein
METSRTSRTIAARPQQQDGAFVAYRSVVQPVELHAPRVIFRRVLHRHHFFFQVFHAIANREL